MRIVDEARDAATVAGTSTAKRTDMVVTYATADQTADSIIERLVAVSGAADKVTVLLTTHYLDEADKLADSLAIVDKGRVVAEGEPERLKRELGAESLDEVYLHYSGRRYSDATRVTEVAGR